MGFTVLSLFDGIACGKVALERANIKVSKYYASEIDPNAIAIAKKNHPNIIEIGDVSKVSYENHILHTEKGDYYIEHIDLLIGGSPCTDFSSIGYGKGMSFGQTIISSLPQYLALKEQGYTFSGQSYLFWEYLRILKEVKPTYFLLENVVMSKMWQGVIDDAISYKPIAINSSLLSAQNRPRLYWTNIKNVSVPSNKNIFLNDIFDNDAPKDDVSHCKTVQKAFPLLVKRFGKIPPMFNAYNLSKITNKACALSRGSMITSSCATLIFVKCDNGVHQVINGLMDEKYPIDLQDGSYNLRRLSIKEMERLQTLPDDYTKVIIANNKELSISKRGIALGNGWTVDVIAYILSYINS